MLVLPLLGFILLFVVLAALQLWRLTDQRKAEEARQRLLRNAAGSKSVFAASMVEALPEPARRYFYFSIAPGTPIRTVADIEMMGQIGLGTTAKPNYQPMRARQILAPPYGLVWQLTAGQGLMQISGSDGFDGTTSWARFWLMKIFPVVRAGGNADHARAAFGRVVAEAVFWSPGALLPQHGVLWEGVGPDIARATVTLGHMSQSVDITVGEDGCPFKVIISRWTDANPEKEYRLQPFGGFPSQYESFDGYMLATRVEGGNLIATKDYFPFYKVRVGRIRLIG